MAADLTIHTRASLQALDVLRAPIWVFDLDRALRWWINLAGVELWGAPSREHLIDPSRPPPRPRARLWTAWSAAGEQVHNLEVRATRDPISGETALLVCSRDLSERLAYERQLERGQQQLAAQAEELARLAAPVLRVWPRLLVLPLIGRVDRGRMDIALAALTPRLVTDQASAVIFDLTGAAFVDVETALSLRRALRVLGLLGCKVSLAGILPELAALLIACDVQLAVPIHQTIADALQEVLRPNRGAPW